MKCNSPSKGASIGDAIKTSKSKNSQLIIALEVSRNPRNLRFPRK
jgi:hypothetical protein